MPSRLLDLVGQLPKERLISRRRGVALHAVLPLFEGFLDEIVARGYPIRTWGLYGFRCMSTTRKDCYGRDEADLSNHAHGLAIDLNWSENPAVSYSAPSGGTACAVPQMTDMPRWVAQAAERWGLFWMGYGSGSGSCAGPTDQKSRIYRDPMHFEFRGSPDQARAILAARGVAEAATAHPVTALAPCCSGRMMMWGAGPSRLPKSARGLRD